MLREVAPDVGFASEPESLWSGTTVSDFMIASWDLAIRRSISSFLRATDELLSVLKLLRNIPQNIAHLKRAVVGRYLWVNIFVLSVCPLASLSWNSAGRPLMAVGSSSSLSTSGRN